MPPFFSFQRRTLKPASEYVWTFGPVLFPVFTFKQPVLFTRDLVGSIAEPSEDEKIKVHVLKIKLELKEQL